MAGKNENEYEGGGKVSLLRLEVEDFLFYEAELIDDWDLEKWVELFDPKGKYLIPSTDLSSELDHNHQLFLIADDYERIKGRAKRLGKKGAHVEYPHSKTRHLVSNTRIKDTFHEDGKEILSVVANVVVYRSKREFDVYTGEMHYLLYKHENSFKILEKKVLLSMDALRPHGKISIII